MNNFKPRFEPTVNLGALLTSISVLGGAIGILIQVSGLWSSVSTTLARFDARTTALESSVSDLKNSMSRLADGQVKLLERQVVDATQNQKIDNMFGHMQTIQGSMDRMWNRLNTLERARVDGVKK